MQEDIIASPVHRQRGIDHLEDQILGVKQGRLNMNPGSVTGAFSKKIWLEESEARLDRMKQLHRSCLGAGK